MKVTAKSEVIVKKKQSDSLFLCIFFSRNSDMMITNSELCPRLTKACTTIISAVDKVPRLSTWIQLWPLN